MKERESSKNHSIEKMFGDVEGFMTLMMQYRCAVREIETKLNVLRDEYSITYDRNPFESIESRIKKPDSIHEKLKKRGWPVTVDSIQSNLTDVAGIRVICSFVDDIYTLAEQLINQDDIVLIKRKDYIKNPKENGYRSLHLILEIPIFLASGKKNMKVEVQFRTIAMDFWASLDHKLRYKKNIENQDIIIAELRECADTITDMDCRMMQIRYMIEEQEKRNLE